MVNPYLTHFDAPERSLVYQLSRMDRESVHPAMGCPGQLGDRAYSHGLYGFSMTPKAGGDTTKVTGKFLTIFQKQADGSWKIAIDCFNYSPPE